MIGQDQKYCFIKTHGCQMNEHDTDRMFRLLKREGYDKTTDIDRADVILLNTCSVRENPENKTYSLLGKLRKRKQNNPDLIIGVSGCVAQQEGKKILQREPSVDMVFGTDHLFFLPEMLKEVQKGNRVVRTRWLPRKKKVQNFIPPSEILHIPTLSPKAYVSITKGCDNFCTFCIVPMTRGRLASRQADNILEECSSFIANGVKEITLLGQNVNSYNDGCDNFYRLLSKVSQLKGLKRLRFTSPYPNDWNDELSTLLTKEPTICNYLHLPFQSGSNRILMLMRRQHTREEYLKKVFFLKKINPFIEISTDLIVGFPSETEEDFCETMDLLEKIQCSHIYPFKYSRRPQTKALNFKDTVDRKTKERRLSEVIELQEKITQKRMLNYIGTVQKILVDGKHPLLKMSKGRTDSHRPVCIEGSDFSIGDFVTVEITELKKYTLIAKPIS